jgi:hypothetical protein
MQNQSVASGKMSRDISDTRYHSLTNYVSLTVLNNVEHIQIQVELHEGLTPLNGQRMSEGWLLRLNRLPRLPMCKDLHELAMN